MPGATLIDAGGVKGRRCLAALAWWRLSGTSHSPSCARGSWSRRLVAPLLFFIVEVFTLDGRPTLLVLFLLIAFFVVLRGSCDFAMGFGGRGCASALHGCWSARFGVRRVEFLAILFGGAWGSSMRRSEGGHLCVCVARRVEFASFSRP